MFKMFFLKFGVCIYIYIYIIYIHSLATLLGTLAGTGLTSFCLQNCINSSWHRFNKVSETFLWDLVHIDMITSRSCCRFVVCTSMMRISRSTSSQKCSIGLRSGDCGGHLSKVKLIVMFKKPVWDDLSFVTWCIILLEVHQKMVHCSHKGMDMVSNNTQVDCGVKRCSSWC